MGHASGPDSHRERASNIRKFYPLQITISPYHHITTYDGASKIRIQYLISEITVVLTNFAIFALG
jgi:hypothetical protein